MRAPAPAILLVALLLPGAPATGARSSALDGVRDAALVKGAQIGLGEEPSTRGKRILGRALSRLARPRDSLHEDLRDAGQVFRLLDRGFPGDPLLDPAVEAAMGGFRVAIRAEEASLEVWRGRTGSARGEARLDRGLTRAEGSLARADGAADRATRARLLAGACRTVVRTRSALRFDAPPIGAPPFEGTGPDFALVDQNPASPAFGLSVSPRDFQGGITAFFFLRAT